jgi:sterol 3beta-glucosyltransferase
MVNDGAEDLDGVRISIPLSQIDRINESVCLTFAHFLSVYLPESTPHVLDSGTDIASNKVQFVTLRYAAEWRQLQHHIDAAKDRKIPDTLSFIIFDFGPLTCGDGNSGTGVNAANTPTQKEAVVRAALALGDESEVWSGYFSATHFTYKLDSNGLWWN